MIRAAAAAGVPTDDFERAEILGQIAGLIAAHPAVGGKVAFKGGAIMNLIDGSPRLSRDLDGAMVAGGQITEKVVREALSTPAARVVVRRIDRIVPVSKDGIRFPVIVCKSLSGQGDVSISLSIHWDAPLLMSPERTSIDIRGKKVDFLVVARLERLSEKVRTFVARGLDRDAYDLYYASTQGLSAREAAKLPSLVHQKLVEDKTIPAGTDLHGLFEEHIGVLATTWGNTGSVVLTLGRPTWAEVEPHVREFKAVIPKVAPTR